MSLIQNSGYLNSYFHPAYNFKGSNAQDIDIYSKPPKYLAKPYTAPNTVVSQKNDENSNKTLKTVGALLTAALLVVGLYKGRNLFKGNAAQGLRTGAQEGASAAQRTAQTAAHTTAPAQTQMVIPAAQQTTTQVVTNVSDDAAKAAKEAAEKAAKEAEELAAKQAAEKAAKEAEELAAKQAAEKAAKEAEELAAKQATEKAAKEAAEKARIEALDKARYQNALKNIEQAKVINKQADDIMAQPDFNQKITELMNTKIRVPKGKYDCTMVETTLDDILKGSIKGTYDKPVGTLYHGTNSGSYKDIIQNGFTNDACHIAESGKGVYFGTMKEGAAQYSTGGVISARYTGRKVAEVEAGVVDELASKLEIQRLFQNKFGLKMFDENNKNVANEIINRMYTQKLNAMGYDAIHSASIGAGCSYITVLNPKHIQILK